jgi:zinc protease
MRFETRHPFGPALSVERHRLDNGLAVVLLRDPSAPVLAYQTWFRVGSRHEVPGRTGIAHLFEHLMFNQTESLPAGEFDRMMELAGGETNAATWVDWTYYRNSLPASELPLAVRLESDRMHNLTLTDAQVESEREVVSNERRLVVDDDVEGFLFEELYKLAFSRHPYHHPTIGWMADIQAISTADARAFYRAYYAPNRATVVIAGDIDPAATLALLETHYGPIPQADVHEPTAEPEPRQDGERRARFAKPVVAERAVYAYKAPAQGHADWLPLLAAAEILTGGQSSRLWRELVVEKEAATGVSAALTPFRDPGLCQLYVSLKRDRTSDAAEEAIDRAVAALAAAPPSAAELAKAKNRLETSFWSDLDGADGKAESLGHYETTLGDHRLLFEAARRLAEIGADEVQRAAATYLVREGRTIVVVEPSGEPGDDPDEEDEEDAE